ncbi:hypothetical protein ACOKW7_15515 [Limnospira platensis CENA597]
MAISELIKVLEKWPNEYSRKEADQNLGEIDPGNQEAITPFVWAYYLD